MQQLAKDCPHKEGAHAPVAGVRDAFGGFVSQQTAEFPAALAQAYCKSAAPLFNPQCSPADLSLGQLYQLLPIKGQFDMPVAHQDGAGIFSVPDWSFPPSGVQDRLKPVRAPTGFFKDIPRSGVFIPVQDESVASEQPLLLCEENWKGARDNPETLAALVQEELANDWLEEVPLEEARKRWQDIAIGKMNVVLVPDKNPRLIVDETARQFRWDPNS
eukprot:s8211_g1.t1